MGWSEYVGIDVLLVVVREVHLVDEEDDGVLVPELEADCLGLDVLLVELVLGEDLVSRR